jgi:hypothetical protein
VKGICPHEPILYNCSLHADTLLDLTWTITFLHKETITVSYNDSFQTGNAQPFGDGIRSSLTRYLPNDYIESTLSIELNVDDTGPAVKCTIGDLPAVEVNLLAYKGTVGQCMSSSSF